MEYANNKLFSLLLVFLFFFNVNVLCFWNYWNECSQYFRVWERKHPSQWVYFIHDTRTRTRIHNRMMRWELKTLKLNCLLTQQMRNQNNSNSSRECYRKDGEWWTHNKWNHFIWKCNGYVAFWGSMKNAISRQQNVKFSPKKEKRKKIILFTLNKVFCSCLVNVLLSFGIYYSPPLSFSKFFSLFSSSFW